jgi:DNA-binding NtrC family response regulator
MPMEKRILVVEDDLCVGRIIFHMIRSVTPNVKIDWFLSAEEALGKINDLESVSGASYDFIIADITLAGRTTGIDLWKTCKRRNLSTQFLFISGMPKEDFLKTVEGYSSSLPKYLQKPLSISEGQEIIALAMS